MKPELRNNKDFWAGVMFSVTGAVAILASRDYPFGSTFHMGPGYFPFFLGLLMIVFGLITMISGLRKSESIHGDGSPRAMILVPLSLVVYGFLMHQTGFIPALMALVFLSAISGREFKFKEVLLLTAVLVFISWTVFILALGLPFPLFKKFW